MHAPRKQGVLVCIAIMEKANTVHWAMTETVTVYSEFLTWATKLHKHVLFLHNHNRCTFISPVWVVLAHKSGRVYKAAAYLGIVKDRPGLRMPICTAPRSAECGWGSGPVGPSKPTWTRNVGQLASCGRVPETYILYSNASTSRALAQVYRVVNMSQEPYNGEATVQVRVRVQYEDYLALPTTTCSTFMKLKRYNS